MKLKLVFSALAATFALQACLVDENENSGPLDGVWIDSLTVYIDGSGRDTTLLRETEILSKWIYSIHDDSLFILSYREDSLHHVQGDRFLPLSDTLWLWGTDTVMARRVGRDLQIRQRYFYWVSFEGDTFMVSYDAEYLLRRYKGSIPPQAWVTGGDFYEPNESRQTASPISAPGFSHWHYLAAGDEDWLSIQADSGIMYVLQYDDAPVETVELTVVDAGGMVLDTAYYLDFDEDEDEPVLQTHWRSPATGTFYLRVRNKGAAIARPYSIGIWGPVLINGKKKAALKRR
jgi:hypothetical protein